jgi:hypothetical protein
MVLTKKKSFSLNNTSINRSRKINRFLQEGSGNEEKSTKELTLFIGFNDYYKIDEGSYNQELNSGEFYIRKKGHFFFLKKFSETEADKYEIKFNDSPHELSKRLNTVTKPNILNELLPLGQGGLPVCIVRQYNVYQMTTSQFKKYVFNKINNFLNDKLKSKAGGSSEGSSAIHNFDFNIHIEKLNNLTEEQYSGLKDRYFNHLINSLFNKINQDSFETDETLKYEIQQILDSVETNLLERLNVEFKTKEELQKLFNKKSIEQALKKMLGLVETSSKDIAKKKDIEAHNAFLDEKHRGRKLWYNPWSANFKQQDLDNSISFYVRKAFGMTGSIRLTDGDTEPHQSYMVVVLYPNSLKDSMNTVMIKFDELINMYDEIDQTNDNNTVPQVKTKLKEVIDKYRINLRKNIYNKRMGDTQINAIEFFSFLRTTKVSEIIEFVKMLINDTEKVPVSTKYYLLNMKS